MSTYAAVSELPACVQNALQSVGYGRKDIQIQPGTSVQLSGSPGNGYRAFVTLVNLTTGEHKTVWGSWGGENMFTRNNPVDSDHREHVLPADGVAITGTRGGTSPVYAVVHVPAALVNRMLPGPAIELTTMERDALYCYHGLRSGPYRQDELRRRRVTGDVLDGLVSRGLLSRNKAGATAITTAGKNAVGDYRGY